MGEPQRWDPKNYGLDQKLDELKYKSLFEYSPVSLWEEDLSDVLLYIDNLKSKGVTDLGRYFESHPEAATRMASLIKVVDVNKATLELFEVESKAEFCKGLVTYFTEEAFELLARSLVDITKGKTELTSETVARTAKGNIRYLLVKTFTLPEHQQTLKRFLLAIIDITERKIAEDKAKEKEQHFRSLFEASPSAVLMLSKDHEILEFNPKAEFIYCKPRAEVIGKDYFELFLPPEAREPVAKDIEKVLSGIPTSGFENPVTAADGKEYVLEWNVSRLLDSSGEPVGVMAVGQDVTERKKAKLLSDILSEINYVISSARDVVEIIPVAAEKAARVLGASAGNVLLKRPDDEWQVCASFGQPKKPPVLKIANKPVGHIAEVLRSKGAIMVADLSTATDIDKKWFSQLGYRAFVSIPLLRDKVIGIAEFYFDGSHEFTEIEIDFINKYAATMALSVDNAYNLRETRLALEDSKTLSRIAAKISQTLDLNQVLETALNETLRTLNVKHGCIYVLEQDKLVIRKQKNLTSQFLEAKSILGPGEGCAGEAAISKEIFAPAKKKRMYVCAESEKLMNLDCLTAAPIVFRGESLGVLELFAPVARRLTTRERQIVNAICDQLAAALQNTRLFLSEKNIAKTLQEALLVMPESVEGLEYGSSYRSATADVAMVGGDFYDLFELNTSKVALLIGDVSGKGLEAATLTSLIKNTIKAYAHHEYSPAAILARATDLIRRNTSAESFVTVFLGVLDISTGKMVYCSAGHPQAMIKRKDSSQSIQLLTRSPAMGISIEGPYIDEQVQMQKDDVLVLYTDGIIEARHDRELFGQARLFEFVKNSGALSAKELPGQIISKADEFGGGELSDDIAILAVSLV